MTDTLEALLADLEAAREPNRDLDLRVGLLVGGWSVRNTMVRDHDGNWNVSSPGGMYPALTESMDDALSLQSKLYPESDWIRTQTGVYLLRNDHHGSWGGVTKNPALGLITAIVRAKLTDKA